MAKTKGLDGPNQALITILQELIEKLRSGQSWGEEYQSYNEIVAGIAPRKVTKITIVGLYES